MTFDPLYVQHDLEIVERPLLDVAGDEHAWAYFDAARKFRFALGRSWSRTRAPLRVCMLNPSTADENAVDPTIRKLLHFAERDSFGGLIVVNLFAYRATDPSELIARARRDDPVDDPRNDYVVRAALRGRTGGVAAWGVAKWRFVRERASVVSRFALSWDCFGTSANSDPLHPLYLPNDTPRKAWR